MKPIVDKALGGSLRLFIQKVYEGSYFSRNEEVVLHANANLPNGSTLEQMNTQIKRMETYLSGFKEIKQFQASVESARTKSPIMSSSLWRAGSFGHTNGMWLMYPIFAFELKRKCV